jgi:ferric-dicitrate binding protein FerR (iron transport regulator)
VNNIEDIDNLISKFLSGNALPDEAMQLEDWKQAHADNFQYYLDCEKVFWGNPKPHATVDTEAAWIKLNESIEEKRTIKRPSKFTYWQIAASLFVLLGIGAVLGYYLNGNRSQQLAFETKSNSQFVKLDDLSEVIISENTKLLLDENYGTKNRTVHLNGSADFVVTHRDDLPFIVDAGNFFIKDIGTKFSVKLSLDADSVYVQVSEGVVFLFDSLGAELELKEQGKAVYIRSKRQLINTTVAQNINTSFKFDDTKLGELVLQLNASFNTTILLQHAALKDCTITSEFNNEDLPTILSIVCETLGLKYEKISGGYLIKGESCTP